MLKGHCLCGAVQYRYLAPLFETIICHCKDCQQAQGSAFAFNSPLNKQYFIIDSGKHALKEYFHTPEKARVFCVECGSPIYSYRLDLPDVVRLRLGTVTEGLLPVPEKQYYTEHAHNFILIAQHQP